MWGLFVAATAVVGGAVCCAAVEVLVGCVQCLCSCFEIWCGRLYGGGVVSEGWCNAGGACYKGNSTECECGGPFFQIQGGHVLPLRGLRVLDDCLS